MNTEKLSGKKIVIHTPELNFKSGGVLMLHNLAKELADLGCNVMLNVSNGKTYQNEFCNNFATLEDIDDATVVVYPEIIEGNPLNAKHVVRWMLCDLGVHRKSDIYKTWNREDLVFHFSTFNAKYDPHEIDILYTLWINPAVKNKNMTRDGSCYLFKKASKFHKNINLIHPMDSVLIDNCSTDEIIEILNQKKYFYCYDPYSFYESIAALCGCIPVIYPIEGMSKLDWLKTKGLFQVYLDKRDNVSGIAYGTEDVQYASDTLHKVWKEKREAVEFGRKTIVNFVDKIDAYFFTDQKKYQFKTVGNFTDLWKRYGHYQFFDHRLIIMQRNLEIKKKDQEIQKKNQEIQKKDQEIELMKTSKFWKLRDKYLAFKNSIFRL